MPILRRILVEAVETRIEGFPSGASPEFGDWYADLAARFAKAGVDFGLAQRNIPNPAYHHEMFDGLVKTRAPAEVHDRILWESLNRYLRILNQKETTS
jgi:hypothetical protein